MMLKSLKRNESRLAPVVLLLLCIGVAILPTRPTYACSCVRPPDPDRTLADATVVFSGQVTNIQQANGRLSVTFDVDEQWKGKPAQNLVIQTAATTAMCGYPFEVGQTYLVYANHRRGRLQTNQCSRTTLISP